MTSSPDTDICKKCNLPRHSKGTASMTQWILVCNCDKKSIGGDESEETVEICKKCGKRINQGRQGSFTQWILRSDMCDCEFPIKVESKTDSSSQMEEVVQKEEEELHLAYDEDFPLERFKPIELLGNSIFSKVYLSVDRLLNKKVAVKCLLNMTESLAIQFQKEAKLGTKMNHPNVASVIDVGLTERSTPYLVLEYFGGVNLKEFIKESDLTEDDITEITLKITAGLEHAHSKGILHHDVKSSNILVAKNDSEEFDVKIIDFGAGIAKDQQNTKDSQFVGTPLYMPPEYAEGQVYNEQSEIYSLGCVIFELICGQPPFSGNTTMEVMKKHASEKIPSIKDFENSITHTEEFDLILGKCLQKDPAKRYGSIKEIREAVSIIGTTQEEIETAREVIDESGQKPFATYIISGIFSFLSGALAAFIFYQSSEIPQERQAIANKPTIVETRLFEADGPNKITTAQLFTFRDEDLKYLPAYATRIKLEGCPIDGSGLKYLKKNKLQVNFLYLNGTLTTDRNLAHLRRMRSLKVLSLANCTITTRGLRRIGRLNLKKLYLSDCEYLDENAAKIIVKLFPNLQDLTIGSKQIPVEEALKLEELDQLRYLKVELKDLTDDNIDLFVNFPVQKLGISNTTVSDKGLLKFAETKTISELELWSCNNITDKGIKKLEKLRPSIIVKRRESVIQKLPQLYNTM